MAISFNSIPSNTRTPFTYIEFDNSLAVQGPTQQPYKAILIGQRLSGGTKSAHDFTRVTSAAQASAFYGAGSMLHEMFKAWFDNNETTEVYGLPVDDNEAGVQAAGTLTFIGATTEAGTGVWYVGGYKVEVAITATMTAIAQAAAFVTAVGLISPRNFTAAIGGEGSEHIVTVTYKHKGVVGNYLDIRQGYYDDEKGLPAGMAVTLVQFTSGATNPSLSSAVAAIPDEHFNVLVLPYTDSTSLTALNNEMEDRWGPMAQREGMVFSAGKGTQGTLGTLGDANNKKLLSIIGVESSPNGVHQWAAAYAAVSAYYLNIDPARPLQTLLIEGVLPAEKKNTLTQAERNLLLYDGISTYYRDPDGAARIERGVTTYKLNELGADDVSYLDVETIFTLSYIRYDLRNYLQRKYPRHKLASDGTRIAPGQAIITPKVAKAEIITKFRDWEELGLVEGFSQFKNDLIVERNASDVNRLDYYLSPNLINQLRINAIKIAYLL